MMTTPPASRLRQLEVETDVKQRSFELREREIDAQARNANERSPMHETISCRCRSAFPGTGDQSGT